MLLPVPYTRFTHLAERVGKGSRLGKLEKERLHLMGDAGLGRADRGDRWGVGDYSAFASFRKRALGAAVA